MDNQPDPFSSNTLPPPNTAPNVTEPQVGPPTNKHHVKRIFVGVVVALIVFALLIVIPPLTGSRQIKAAKKVSDEFVQDMDTNNPSAAYALTAAAFQQTTTEANLANIAQQVQQHVTGRPVENGWNITNQTGQPQSALITYTASGVSSISVTLQKINDNWVVLNFKYSN